MRVLFMARDVSSLGVFEMRSSQLLGFRLISAMDARKKQKHTRIYSIGAIRKMSTSTYSPPPMKRQVNYARRELESRLWKLDRIGRKKKVFVFTGGVKLTRFLCFNYCFNYTFLYANLYQQEVSWILNNVFVLFYE